MIKEFLREINGINLIDVGSSGKLDSKWDPINSHINLIGFDPNEEECRRMMNVPHQFKSVNYLPYAIAGEQTSSTLYKTKSIYCYSLLPPNTPWLQRFAFAHLFERIGEESLNTQVLSDIEQVMAMDVDVLKVDTQGVELPILQNSGKILDKAFLVETETGFVENYLGETTYAQIDEFMRANDFLLFDINTSHRIARNNVFKNLRTGAEQLMWCEAIWLKDYVALAKKNKLTEKSFNREKVLKALIVCSLQGCIDYGYEIATLAFDMKMLTEMELQLLANKNAWIMESSTKSHTKTSYSGKLINYTLRLLPLKLRKLIKQEAEKSIRQKHLLRF